MPARRPATVEGGREPAVQTAALQRTEKAEITVSGRTRAFAAVQGADQTIAGLLDSPVASIASLPFAALEQEEEDNFDGQEALLAWAISPPGSRMALSAPVVVERALADHSIPSEPDPEALAPPDKAHHFDGSRFWSDG
jgi:hypothetical protein